MIGYEIDITVTATIRRPADPDHAGGPDAQ